VNIPKGNILLGHAMFAQFTKKEYVYIWTFCVMPLSKGEYFQKYHSQALLGALVSVLQTF
jgi:hypothetical protein